MLRASGPRYGLTCGESLASQLFVGVPRPATSCLKTRAPCEPSSGPALRARWLRESSVIVRAQLMVSTDNLVMPARSMADMVLATMP